MDFYRFMPIVSVLLCVMGVFDGIRLMLGESSAEYLIRRVFPHVTADMDARCFSVHWSVRYCCGAAALVLPVMAEHFSYERYDPSRKAAIPVISIGLILFAAILLFLAFATLWHGAVLSRGRLCYIGINPFDRFEADVCDVRIDDCMNGGMGSVDVEEWRAGASETRRRVSLYAVHAPFNRRYSCLLNGLGSAVRQVQFAVPSFSAVLFGQVTATSVAESFSSVAQEKAGGKPDHSSQANAGTGEDG